MAEIFVSDGAKSDLGNLLDLFDVDNTVLVPDPVYPVYVDDNVMAGRKILYMSASAENNFLPMPDDNVHADIVYLCSPNNPTGATYTVDQLKEWVRWAKANNALIWPAAFMRLRALRIAPLRFAASPRSQALPAPAAATPLCRRPLSLTARA